MKKIFFILFILTFVTSYGQKAPAKFGDIPKEDLAMQIYPLDSAAEAVVLVDFAESAIRYDQNHGFQLFFERLRRVKILTKEGLKWADFSIPLYHDSDQDEVITNMKVVTYNMENGKVIETKGKKEDFIKERYNENLNFTKVAWPDVKEGSILEISYRVTSDFLFNFQDWEFQSTIPTRLSEYRARIPEYFNYEKYTQGYLTMDINEQETIGNSFTVNSSQRTSSGGFGAPTSTSFNQDKIEYQETRFRWATQNAPAFKKEPFITTPRDYISKINFELSYTKFPNQFSNPGIKRYMGTWQDINRTYWDRVGGEITGNNSLKSKVDELLAGMTTPEQKIAAIFEYVRQIFLWDGTYRVYPESSPKKMLDEKKGSSAEINFLLASMLEKAGFTVNPVLLSTRDHGFVREAMPISSQFNDVVCQVKFDEKMILLDATDKLLPIGMLPEPCLNGRGFVVSKDGFAWVSLQPLVRSKTVNSAELSITGQGEIKGLIKIEKTGYNSTEARKSYLTDGEKNYLNAFSESRAWTLIKSEFQNVKEIQLPFKEIHEIAINEHLTEAAGIIYLNPFILGRIAENPFKQESRAYPVDFGHAFEEVYLAKLAIPEGYIIDELPVSKVLGLPGNTGKFSYSVTQSGNVINVISSMVIGKGLYTQEEYPGLREFYSLLVAKQAEQIVLKKK